MFQEGHDMVEVPIPKEKWTGKIGVLELGASAEKGGSRGKKVLVGRRAPACPSFRTKALRRTGRSSPGRSWTPLDELPSAVAEFFGDAVKDPAQWAKAWVEKYHADVICLKLLSTNPEEANVSPEAAAETVMKVLAAVDVPLIVYGCGQEEKDAKTLEAVSNIAPKERLLLGYAEEGHYKSISAASMANDHPLIAFSNLDINLAKQITILLTDFGVKKDNIAMDPLMAGLGMGLDYSYSVNERIRLAALMGDGMLQQPMLCDSTASWKSAEATDEIVGYGDAEGEGCLVGGDHRHSRPGLRSGHTGHAASRSGRARAGSAGRSQGRELNADRHRDLQASAEEELRGVQAPHLPGVRHAARQPEGQAGGLPLCLGRRQAVAGGLLGPADQVGQGRAPARPTLEMGDETELYRHDKKFFHPVRYAMTVSDTLTEAEAISKVQKANAMRFERVGQIMALDMVCVRNDSKDAGKFVAMVDKVMSSTELPTDPLQR